jgi:hypothetical protein
MTAQRSMHGPEDPVMQPRGRNGDDASNGGCFSFSKSRPPPLAALLLTRGRLDIPPVRFSADAHGALFTLNAVSAGLLMVFRG